MTKDVKELLEALEGAVDLLENLGIIGDENDDISESSSEKYNKAKELVKKYHKKLYS